MSEEEGSEIEESERKRLTAIKEELVEGESFEEHKNILWKQYEKIESIKGYTFDNIDCFKL